MRRRAAMLACWAVLPLADARGSEPGLTVPRTACWVDRSSQLRPLLGVPGGYILGEPLHFGALAGACGAGFTLVKTPNTLEWLDASGRLLQRWAAPEGTALFGLSQDAPRAVVHFPASGEWFLAAPERLHPMALDLEDAEVLSLAWLGPDRIAAAVRRSGRMWFVQAGLDGFITEARELAEAMAPILVAAGGAIVWSAGKGLSIRQPTGVQWHIPLPAPPTELLATQDGSVQVRLAGGNGRWMLLLRDQRDELYRLPEAPP